MNPIIECTWCGQRVKDLCSHPKCLQAYRRGFDTIKCMDTWDINQKVRLSHERMQTVA